MIPIPKKVREILAVDPFMNTCCLRTMAFSLGLPACDGKVEWHHAWKYATKRIQEVWAIVPGCKRHHELATMGDRVAKEAFQRVSLGRSTEDDLGKYPKMGWVQTFVKINEELRV